MGVNPGMSIELLYFTGVVLCKCFKKFGIYITDSEKL